MVFLIFFLFNIFFVNNAYCGHSQSIYFLPYPTGLPFDKAVKANIFFLKAKLETLEEKMAIIIKNFADRGFVNSYPKIIPPFSLFTFDGVVKTIVVHPLSEFDPVLTSHTNQERIDPKIILKIKTLYEKIERLNIICERVSSLLASRLESQKALVSAGPLSTSGFVKKPKRPKVAFCRYPLSQNKTTEKKKDCCVTQNDQKL